MGAGGEFVLPNGLVLSFTIPTHPIFLLFSKVISIKIEVVFTPPPPTLLYQAWLQELRQQEERYRDHQSVPPTYGSAGGCEVKIALGDAKLK